MNLTDIMLFGNAIVGGSGGSSSGVSDSAVFLLQGTDDEIIAKYPVDDVASMVLGSTVVKLSDVPFIPKDDSWFVLGVNASGAHSWRLAGYEDAGYVCIANECILSVYSDYEEDGVKLNKGLYVTLNIMVTTDDRVGRYKEVLLGYST